MGDIIGSIASIKGLAAMLGISFLALLAAVVILRKVVAATIEAFEQTKWFVAKYRSLLTSKEAVSDYTLVKRKWDVALEYLADLLVKIGMAKSAVRMRNVIKF